MPYISNTEDVREESENILEIDKPDEDIIEAQEAAYDFISSQPEIGEYDINHPKADAIRQIETYLAASFVLTQFKQYADKAPQKRETALALLDMLKKGLVTSDVGDYYSVTSYQSYSAAMSEDREQTTVPPYSSMKPGYAYGMGVGGRGEPWQKPYYFYDRVKTPRV